MSLYRPTYKNIIFFFFFFVMIYMLYVLWFGILYVKKHTKNM